MDNIKQLIELNIEIEGLLRVAEYRKSNQVESMLLAKSTIFLDLLKDALTENKSKPEISKETSAPLSPQESDTEVEHTTVPPSATENHSGLKVESNKCKIDDSTDNISGNIQAPTEESLPDPTTDSISDDTQNPTTGVLPDPTPDIISGDTLDPTTDPTTDIFTDASTNISLDIASDPIPDQMISEGAHDEIETVLEMDVEDQEGDGEPNIDQAPPLYNTISRQEDNYNPFVTEKNYGVSPSQDFQLESGHVMRVDEMIHRQSSRELKKAFSLNDRFRYIREIFDNDANYFDETIKILDMLSNLDEVYDYLLGDLGLSHEEEAVKDFLAIIYNHFND